MSQMNIGQLIDVLERKDPDKYVEFDFVHFTPRGVHSYRGYYDQLAIGYERGGNMKVGELLTTLRDAVGKTFTGYKGGEYTMFTDTAVWVANNDESGGTAIVDVRDDWRIVLVTQCVD